MSFKKSFKDETVSMPNYFVKSKKKWQNDGIFQSFKKREP